MSDTILGGNWTVYYLAENRQKRIKWSGSATGTNTVNEVYSALQDLFDELTQLDDGSVLSAQTPTEYTIGIIDPNDNEPWFIDKDSAEHLTGGALKTAGWLRVTDSRAGIVKIVCNNTDIVSDDIGIDITHADLDAGTLLDVKGTGAGSILYIRPDSSAAANAWDSATGTITCNAHTATQSSAATSGESIWSNIYSIGTIQSNTHLYLFQANALLVAYKGTSDWWGDGHIDILVNVKDAGDTATYDNGYVTVFARQYTNTFDNYIVNLSSGGRNPIPLATGVDSDNKTGFKQMVLTTASGDFTVGEVIKDDTDSTIQGIVRTNTGTAPNTTITYYPIGDPITPFSVSTGQFTGQTSSVTATAVDPTNVGPANIAGVSIVHGTTTADINEDGTNENYSITMDCNNNFLYDIYEWCKYLNRRGETATTNTDGVQGQAYIGSDYRLKYSGTITGTFSEGNTCTQTNTNAKGTIVSVNSTAKIVILRNSRGTFNITDIVTDDTDSGTFTPDTSTTVISPIKASPFGTFAGGKFFCAPGIKLINYKTTDANNFQLTDDTGAAVTAPNKVTVAIGNTRVGDKIAVFRLDVNGVIEKDTYTGTVQSAEATTVVVAEDIDPEEPGKTAGGVLRIVDASPSVEYRLRYASWTSKTFTLASRSFTATTATTTTITKTGEFIAANCSVGDLVWNVTRTAYSYVTVRTDDTITISPAIASQTDGDSIKLNVLPVATTTSDKVYVPFMDVYETVGTDGTPGTESVSVTYTSPISVRVRARKGGSILPYEADLSIGATGLSNNIIRTPDTIYQ